MTHYLRSTDEWYTPRPLIDATKQLFRTFFDPYGEPGTPAFEAASRAFVYPEQDALVDDWPEMPVFFNPPYSRPGPHVDRLLRSGSEFVAVLNSSTASAWWQQMAQASDLILFPRERIRFLRWKDGEGVLEQPSAPRYNNTIFVRTSRTPCDVRGIFGVCGLTGVFTSPVVTSLHVMTF